MRAPRARRVAPAPAPAQRRTVAVIVPTYNYGSLLEGCVRTVLDQEGVDVRVRIVDDRSPDDSAVVGAALAAADPRVELHANAVNQGLIGSANDGLRWAADIGSDYVVLLSADDFLTPGALRRAVAVMEAEPSVGLVYGHAPYFRPDGGAFPETRSPWKGTDVWAGRDWIATRCRCGHNAISSPEAVVRTSVQTAVGGYDPDCTHASDLNMWLRVAAVSDVAYVRGAEQAVYRVHGGSMLRAEHSALRDLDERFKAFNSFFAGAGARVRGADQLRAQAMRTLARQALWRASRAYDRDLVTGDGALPVDDLIAFAFRVCPDASRLSEWHGLRVRRALGAGRSRWFPPFVATGAAHRLRGHVATYRGARTGI